MVMTPCATGAGVDCWKPLVHDHTLATGLRWSLFNDLAMTLELGSWSCDWAGLFRITTAHPIWGGP